MVFSVGLLLFYRLSGNVGCLIASDPPQPPLKRGAFRLNILYNNKFTLWSLSTHKWVGLRSTRTQMFDILHFGKERSLFLLSPITAPRNFFGGGLTIDRRTWYPDNGNLSTFFYKCSHSIILNPHNTTFLPLRPQKNLSQPSITIIFSYSVSRLRNL
jgi:hypothetical protein